MALIVITNLPDPATGGMIYFEFRAHYSDTKGESRWLDELLQAKNDGQSIIIQGTLIDTKYVTHAYVT